MAWKSRERRLSYEILNRSDSFADDEILTYNCNPAGINGVSSSPELARRSSGKNKGPSKKKKKIKFKDSEGTGVTNVVNSASHHPIQVHTNHSFSLTDVKQNADGHSVLPVVYEESIDSYCALARVACVIEEVPVHKVSSVEDAHPLVGVDDSHADTKIKQRLHSNCNTIPILETADSVGWKNFMVDYPSNPFMMKKSPVKYFMKELSSGNSLRNTTTIGNENDREGVYDTIFHLPWRCELLINVGFLLCFDSFLSLLTIMPTRILSLLWKLINIRLFKRLSAAEMCDFGCFVVLASGILILELTDISLIYHMIRGQGTIKLYVVYNVLEIFDKLFQSFVGDVLQTLFNSAHGFSNSSSTDKMFWLWRFISDQTLAIFVTIAHSFILLAQAITLSTCIVAHSNALLALLVSNNFAEIKTNVFKRFSQDNIQSIVYSDSIERFHISAFLLFVLAQNILEGEGHWLRNFFHNALLVCVCEMVVDMVKHSFLAKFNNIKPVVYSEFLENLCRQTLDNQNEDGARKLKFVPLAPASVVIRVMTPIYNAHLPYFPFGWRFFWMWILLVVTYVMLCSLKVVVGITLRKHAIWYVRRCELRKHHLHLD